MPRSWAMILLGLPATSPPSTSRSRPDRRLRRSRIAATRANRSLSLTSRDSATRIADSRTSSSNGFSMKSTAPAFIASTASGTSPCPVMTMTGKPDLVSRRWRCRSSPLMSGMRMSVTTQPACACGSSFRKATAESYTRTANPSVLSRKASDWRTATSSSITWTTWLDGMGRLLARPAQGEAEDGAAARAGLDPDPAAMRLDDGAADREPKSHALALGGDEGLEQVRGHFGRQARPGIGDADLRKVPGGGGCDLEPALARRLDHDFDGVANEVDQHLLDLNAVGEHQVGLGIEPEGDGNAPLARAHQRQRAGVLDQPGQAFDPPVALAAGHELAQAADDMAGAHRLLGRAAQGLAQHRRRLVLHAVEQALAALEVVVDRRQRLVDLVGERRGHLAERGIARHVRDLRLQLLQPAFGELLVGEVADEAGEMVPLGRAQLADREMYGKGRAVLALADDDAADADDAPLAGREVALDIGVMLLAIGRGHEQADVLAGGLGHRVAEQPLGRRAERFDPPLLVDDDHGVRYGLQDRAQPRLGRFQRLRHRRALVDQGLETVQDPSHVAIGAQHGNIDGTKRRSAGRRRRGRRDQ